MIPASFVNQLFWHPLGMWFFVFGAVSVWKDYHRLPSLGSYYQKPSINNLYAAMTMFGAFLMTY